MSPSSQCESCVTENCHSEQPCVATRTLCHRQLTLTRACFATASQSKLCVVENYRSKTSCIAIRFLRHRKLQRHSLRPASENCRSKVSLRHSLSFASQKRLPFTGSLLLRHSSSLTSKKTTTQKSPGSQAELYVTETYRSKEPCFTTRAMRHRKTLRKEAHNPSVA